MKSRSQSVHELDPVHSKQSEEQESQLWVVELGKVKSGHSGTQDDPSLKRLGEQSLKRVTFEIYTSAEG